tara:strand:- start:7403 stop:7891 length:489 start_codon:yes stop_codon:yes gene_type:complete
MNLPLRYIPKNLTKKDKLKQKNQLKKSRNFYKKGRYFTREKLKSFKSKKSHHILNAEKLYNLKNLSLNNNLAKKTKCQLKTLKKIFQKGQGAYYSSGSRPNQTAHSWAYARLASAISGGKASAVDLKLLELGCNKNSKALKLALKAKKTYKNGRRRVMNIKI